LNLFREVKEKRKEKGGMKRDRKDLYMIATLVLGNKSITLLQGGI